MTATRKQVFINQYQASHGVRPFGHGRWIFFNKVTHATVTHVGTYGEARRALPAGLWSLQP